MSNNKVDKSSEETIAYENARMNKTKDNSPVEVSDKNVEGINKRLNPDKNSMESRG